MVRSAIAIEAAGSFLAATMAMASPVTITAPPEAALRADPFYARYLDADGIPIIASSKVPDSALIAAREIVQGMLAKRRDLASLLQQDGTRIAIMAPDEQTTDLPEQRNWKKPAIDDPRLTVCERKHYAQRIGALSDRQYWNQRARDGWATHQRLGGRSARMAHFAIL